MPVGYRPDVSHMDFKGLLFCRVGPCSYDRKSGPTQCPWPFVLDDVISSVLMHAIDLSCSAEGLLQFCTSCKKSYRRRDLAHPMSTRKVGLWVGRNTRQLVRQTNTVRYFIVSFFILGLFPDINIYL